MDKVNHFEDLWIWQQVGEMVKEIIGRINQRLEINDLRFKMVLGLMGLPAGGGAMSNEL